MTADIKAPTERVCERCGRRERWDDEREAWQLETEDEEIGSPHCIHEWDINGSFQPIDS